MRNIASVRAQEAEGLSIRLRVIWSVDVNGSYRRICARRIDDSDYIAVRTLKGRGRIEMDDGRLFYPESGSLCLLPAGRIVRYETEGDSWEFYWFMFDILTGSVSGMDEMHGLRLSAQEKAEMERCFVGLSGGAQAETIRAEALFTCLLSDWQVRIAENRTGGVATEEIVALLEKGRRRELSIQEMAKEAGMCERSFREAVHRATGLSPKAYLIRGEMTAAMELLRTSDMNISEIASCFNYSSPLYFSRAFKKYYGISPQYVRQGIKL